MDESAVSNSVLKDLVTGNPFLPLGTNINFVSQLARETFTITVPSLMLTMAVVDTTADIWIEKINTAFPHPGVRIFLLFLLKWHLHI